MSVYCCHGLAVAPGWSLASVSHSTIIVAVAAWMATISLNAFRLCHFIFIDLILDYLYLPASVE